MLSRKINNKIRGYIFILVVMLHLPVQGQTFQVTLELLPSLEKSQMLFLSDFDLFKLGEGPILFRITMMNRNAQEKEVIGKFSVVSKKLGLLLNGETKPFVLKTNTTILTNQDIFTSNSSFSLQEYSFTDASEDLRKVVLQTGKLPPDQYDFIWEIYDVKNPQNAASDLKSLLINSPSNIDLIAPGAYAGFGNLPIVFTPLPYFRWESDAQKFRLKVCEQENLSQTPEEVMQNTPRLEVEVTDAKYFQYPTIGAWPLEEGKTYFWQVMAVIQTSTGEILLPSEIWGFKLADLSGGLTNIEQMRIISSLRTILGDSAVELLFGPNGELYGFEVTGVAFMNGKPISFEDLTKLIEDIVAGKIKVKEMKVLDM